MTALRIGAFLLACLLAGAGGAEASEVYGTWMIRDLVLHVFGCENQVCGRIAWLKDPSRRTSECGKTIVWGLQSAGPDQWDGGSILDPDDHNVYQLSAVYQPDGTLHARIFKGLPMLGETEVLKRVDLQSFPGQC
jgi:uncharacterized protein (DUF2147 family)